MIKTHQLALTPTPFLGRSQEMNEINVLLSDPSCRLLTLVGPGGMGKTRLALEVASQKRALFQDGIFFVSLASLSRADDILLAIAEATPFQFPQDMLSPREQFLAYLRKQHAQHVLLVLDNAEHLLDVMGIIADILAVTSGLKILVTSREALNLQEEWVRQISGLTYPDQEESKPLEEYGAVQLFLDRARRIRGDFDLTEDEKGVLDICRLVEGMPLAIELAAGWLKTLRPTDIAREIQHNLDILETRARNMTERHRNIRSVFGHSWLLMSDVEREVFQKVSVFRGGFRREAAEIVANASLQTLAGLIDQSMLRSHSAGRYDVHELLRQYGAEQLANLGQTEAVQQSYIDYYLGLLCQLEEKIKTQDQITALDTIVADFENVRHAWQLAIEKKQFVALSQAVESLHLFADMRGRYHEIVALLRAAMEQFPPAPTQEQRFLFCRIQARFVRLVLLGSLRIEQDLRPLIDVCLATARAQQDQAEIGFCLFVSGILAIWEVSGGQTSSLKIAELMLRECLVVFEAVGDRFYQAEALAWLACKVSEIATEYHVGQSLLQQSLVLRREIGDYNGIAWITMNISCTARFQHDYPTCERYARESLALMREIRSLKGILETGFNLIQITILKGELEEAQVLAEQMRDLANETNNLDSASLSTDMLAFLFCMKNEAYIEDVVHDQIGQTVPLAPFFTNYYDMGTIWRQALVDCGRGQYAAARSRYAAILEQQVDDPAPTTFCLALEAVALADEGMLEAATELLGLAFQQSIWVNGWLHRWQKVSRLRVELASQLGEDLYQAAWERGGRQDLVTTVESMLGKEDHIVRKTSHPSLLEPLSERELEVLGLIARGLSNREIAQSLVLSTGTVKVHTRNIYGKLGVGSRTQALVQATRFKLL